MTKYFIRQTAPWAAVLLVAATCRAADQPQWGQANSRNMVSDETNLPAAFTAGQVGADGEIDPKTTRGVRWTARLGSITYASPVIAGGKVFIGTNNRPPRDERHQGDRGVLLCLDEKTGRYLWQLVVPKYTKVRWADWHYTGISASPAVVGERAYVMTHRAEVLCLDVNGLADGNAGPYTDEGTHMVERGRKPVKPRPTDADIVWIYDMAAELAVVPHNATNCSILVRGDLLYICTSNGVHWQHSTVPSPGAPSLIVLNRKTGKLVARDNANIGPRIYHGQWSSPALGRVGGKDLVFFGGGDGVCYAFAPPARPTAKGPALLTTAWSFTCDTKGKFDPARASRSPADPNGPSTIIAMPVFHDGRLYVAAGGDPWHGKRSGGLYCVKPDGSGDITASGRLWSYADLGQSVSTPAIADGLLYIASYDGRVHCLDARTGKAVWVHDAGGTIYGSPLLADGKLYVTTLRRELQALAAGRKLKHLSTVRLSSQSHSGPVAANGTLYVTADHHLYAVGK